jgi:hypothetical protein
VAIRAGGGGEHLELAADHEGDVSEEIGQRLRELVSLPRRRRRRGRRHRRRLGPVACRPALGRKPGLAWVRALGLNFCSPGLQTS